MNAESGPFDYTRLSRFIFEKRHFSGDKVKHQAFLPSPKDLETSAFGIDDLAEYEVWQIGDDVAGKSRGLASLARADFDAKSVAEVKLTVHSDPASHPRHVVLRGWPQEKDQQKSIAFDLCALSVLIVR
jgi:hypothetical protein